MPQSIAVDLRRRVLVTRAAGTCRKHAIMHCFTRHRRPPVYTIARRSLVDQVAARRRARTSSRADRDDVGRAETTRDLICMQRRVVVVVVVVDDGRAKTWRRVEENKLPTDRPSERASEGRSRGGVGQPRDLHDCSEHRRHATTVHSRRTLYSSSQGSFTRDPARRGTVPYGGARRRIWCQIVAPYRAMPCRAGSGVKGSHYAM